MATDKKRHRAGGKIAVIGPGRVGQAMGRLLSQAGVPIAVVAARKLANARRAVGFIGAGTPRLLRALGPNDATVFLLTTSDSSFAPLAADLARRGTGPQAWKGKVVLHTCGSLPSAVLEPLRRCGAAIGSVHPYQTVPSAAVGVQNLRGTFWAIEGDRAALQMARDWVSRLAGVAFPIRPEDKTLYHLSAFLVCPTVVTLMEQAQKLLAEARVPSRIARPMLRQFVDQTTKNLADMGGRRSLTGPAVRGDWTTIERHLKALRQSAPEFLPVYRALLAAMLRLAGKEVPNARRRAHSS